MGKQVLRSGTSVGAHYCEASRSRSTAGYISKIGGALQELEETVYWIELLAESQIVPTSKLQGLIQEAQEIGACQFCKSLHLPSSPNPFLPSLGERGVEASSPSPKSGRGI